MKALQKLGELFCNNRVTFGNKVAHDLRRNGRIILECRKTVIVSGHSRNCWSTEPNINCEYLEHGCSACFEPFWLSVVRAIFRMPVRRRVVFYKIRQGAIKNYVSWAGFLPLVADRPLLEPAGNPIWFHFGRTADEALAALREEVTRKFGKRFWICQGIRESKVA